ncbi:hypothetical protein F4802DRAFT_41746 [Xylaria palmicola]|nr:hypothetical protein F4802DRAFT_41746 [Xylaria palmicola]
MRARWPYMEAFTTRGEARDDDTMASSRLGASSDRMAVAGMPGHRHCRAAASGGWWTVDVSETDPLKRAAATAPPIASHRSPSHFPSHLPSHLICHRSPRMPSSSPTACAGRSKETGPSTENGKGMGDDLQATAAAQTVHDDGSSPDVVGFHGSARSDAGGRGIAHRHHSSLADGPIGLLECPYLPSFIPYPAYPDVPLPCGRRYQVSRIT